MCALLCTYIGVSCSYLGKGQQQQHQWGLEVHVVTVIYLVTHLQTLLPCLKAGWHIAIACMQHARVSSALECVSGFTFYVDNHCVRTVCNQFPRKHPCMQDGNFTHCKYIAQCEAKWCTLIDHWILHQWSPPSQLTKVMENPHSCYSFIGPHHCGLLIAIITGLLVVSVHTQSEPLAYVVSAEAYMQRLTLKGMTVTSLSCHYFSSCHTIFKLIIALHFCLSCGWHISMQNFGNVAECWQCLFCWWSFFKQGDCSLWTGDRRLT